MPLLTIFTPTYNRAHTLPRTYRSLLRQENKDFIWLIVDDGSTDNTREMVDSWTKLQSGFEIRYIYKENGGMHTAHNTAYENIDTELNTCIDSDDELAEGAVEYIIRFWKKYGGDSYAGIVGLDADLNTGKVIGTRFPKGMKETTLGVFYRNGGRGDKKLVYRTDLMKKIPPYPVFEGEKYVYLSYKYGICDKMYPLLTTNKILCNVEYQQDGSSMNMIRQYRRNPKGFAFLRKNNLLSEDRSIGWLYKEAVHYVSSSMIGKNPHFIRESPRKGLTVLAVPPGIVLAGYIAWKTSGKP